MQLNSEARAISYYFSGTCNLNCVYCFNPKVEYLNQDTNKIILSRLESGKFIEDLHEIIDKDNFIDFSLWGGEPTINIPSVLPNLHKLFEEFPNLNNLMFSTNISTRKFMNNCIDMVDKISEIAESLERNITVEVQLSLDGPPEITDPNRGEGITEIILPLIEEFTAHILKNKYENNYSKYLKVDVLGKPTLEERSIKWLSEEENFKYWYRFYDNLYDRIFQKVGKDTGYRLNFHSITLAHPGQYTANDGRAYSKVLSMMYGHNGYSPIEDVINLKYIRRPTEIMYGQTIRMMQALLRSAYQRYFGELQRSFSCSAGLSSYGYDYNNTAHLCQETFFYDKDVLQTIESKNLTNDFTERTGWDFNVFDKFVKDKISADKDDKFQMSRFQYLTNVIQTDFTPRSSFYDGLVHELYLSGMIDQEFYSDVLNRILLSKHMAIGSNMCFAGNIFSTGHGWIDTTSYVKLLGNGAHEILLNEFFKNNNKFIKTVLKGASK